ncbi:MAG: hypothetical protein NVS3B7_20360 [Candidatus Elarobacter sp.]
MRRLRGAVLALSLGCTTSAPGLAQAVVPAGTPPQPGAIPTANLIFDAMLATARAAATNPQAAQAAQPNANAAVQRYNAGDLNGARSAAIDALIDANRAQPVPIPVLSSTIPQTSALQTQPFPLRGDIAAIDADAFVAQARGAVLNCQAAHAQNSAAAAASLAAAQRDARAGRYRDVRVEARAAVDLCARATVHAPR